jgi:hypothetical protein
MGKLIPYPKKGESKEDYRKRLVNLHNNNMFVKIGLKKKLK